jgi:hypothetical protein
MKNSNKTAERYAYSVGDGMRIVAALAALADLETTLQERRDQRARRRGIATADASTIDPAAITRKIDALRGQFRNQALQVRYESKQKLANLLREISHVLTDLIHSMSVSGDNTEAMKKLQKQIFNVTTSISFSGEEDTNHDGIKDTAPDEDLELGRGKSTKEASHNAFLDAVKSLRSDKPEKKSEEDTDSEDEDDDAGPDADAPKKAEKEGTGKPVPNNFKKTIEENRKEHRFGGKKAEPEEDAEEDTDSEDGEDSEDSESKPVKLKKSGKLKLKKSGKDKSEKSEKSEKSGFVSGLLAESSFCVTSGLRFAYLGIKTVRLNKKTFKVVAASFGTHSKPTMRTYFYKPTDKFFGGDAEKANKAFTKLLSAPGGYSLVSMELNKRVKTGHLEIVHTEDSPAKEVLHDTKTWSFKGVEEHPTKPEKKALWFEIGAQLFAAVPSKTFENGKTSEAADYIRLRIVGSKKDGAPGLSYNDGLAALQNLVETKKIKVIFHGGL